MKDRGVDRPRAVALEILERVDGGDAFVEPLLNAIGHKHPDLSSLDHAFVTQIVYGVQRWRGKLDWHLERFSSRPLHRIQPRVLEILRAGAFQILFLDKVPNRAAVDESVRLAHALVPGEGPSRFVNAVLRSLIRGAASLDLPAEDKDPAAHLTVAYSMPRWFADRLVARFGLDGARMMCVESNKVPDPAVRANTLKCTPAELSERLGKEGAEAGPAAFSPVGLRVRSKVPLTHLGAFAEGLFYIQSEASQLIPYLLDPQPGESILDACAAPGGKATHCAQLMGNKGEIVAIDKNARKLRDLAETSRRIAVTCVRTAPGDAGQPSVFAGKTFDRVLVDAPCSGLGDLRRNPERRWRSDPAEIPDIVREQLKILKSAAGQLKPGGVLVYSTCTVTREENEGVVERFLKQNRGFELDRSGGALPEECRRFVGEDGLFRTYPRGMGLEGFFAARFRCKEA